MEPGRSFPFALWIAASVERRGRAPGRKGLYFNGRNGSMQFQQIDFRRAVEAEGECACPQPLGDQVGIAAGDMPGIGVG